MSSIIKVSSPSNIALIKYMGKKNHELNVPSNSSLSWTIDHLRTYVEVKALSNKETDRWAPLESQQDISLSESSVARYLNFWKKLKSKLGVEGNFLVSSGNNFPFGCGLASSASSFSALTLAAHELSCKQGQKPLNEHQLALLSAQGSGSSCRSLLEGWVKWSEQGVQQVSFPFDNLIHKVIVVESGEKKISSSQAHKMISSSLLNVQRQARANQRLEDLCQVLQKGDWKRAYEICWSEFWDMHALFETSEPSFGYMTALTMKALNSLRLFWQNNGDGPLITMDAGPNVHMLFREDQNKLCDDILANCLEGFSVL